MYESVHGRIFFLDLGAGRILSANPDGSDLKTIVEEGRKLPDGLAIDAKNGHMYWTNMGNPSANDGSILRSDLDGSNITMIVPPGATFTPKQVQLEPKAAKLYWCDREGMRVMRCNLDGSDIETLVQTGATDADRLEQTRWCVGIAVDPDGGKFYWTQKGGDNAGEGRIFRAGIEIPAGQAPTNRTDLEILYEGLPEPIDLEPRPWEQDALLDRPWRPTARQYGEPRPDGYFAGVLGRTRNSHLTPDGGHRPCIGPERQPHVRNRPSRLCLQRGSRWIESEGAICCIGQSCRDCVCGTSQRNEIVSWRLRR
jgi:hypothetical protein